MQQGLAKYQLLVKELIKLNTTLIDIIPPNFPVKEFCEECGGKGFEPAPGIDPCSFAGRLMPSNSCSRCRGKGFTYKILCKKEEEDLFKPCPKCKGNGLQPLPQGIDPDSFAATLMPKVSCLKCKGTGEVDDTVRSVRAGTDLSKQCSICKGSGKCIE